MTKRPRHLDKGDAITISRQATSEDGSVGATAWLPRDVLTGVLVRLPVNDLLRFHLVCKEWREVICDPAFIDEHIDHGPQALTHTIVFFRGSCPAYRDKYLNNNFRDGRGQTKESKNGEGYLLDEQWRVTARFTVGESEDMVGACNGLLCFLDVLRDAINIVEPFTGESIALPLPPESETWHKHGDYCFAFDPSSRRYKLVHLSRVKEQTVYVYTLYVYTIGEGTNWRSVSAAPPDNYWVDPMMIVDGAVYWSVTGKNLLQKLARFDLAKEEITSELIEFTRLSDQTALIPVFLVLGCLDARVCLMTHGLFTHGLQQTSFIGEGARWDNSTRVSLPSGRCLTRPHRLQRGHLLQRDNGNGGLYAHPIAPASDDLSSPTLLLTMAISSRQDTCRVGDTDSMPVTPRCNTRGLFVPVPPGQVTRVPHKAYNARTFCYAPPVSRAPLAHYFGKLSELHKL